MSSYHGATVIADAAQLPAGRLAIYGCGGRGLELLEALEGSRPDVEVALFLDSYRDGSLRGRPVRRYEPGPDALGGCRTVVFACAPWQEIILAHPELAQTDLYAYDPFDHTCITRRVLEILPPEVRFGFLEIGAREFEHDFFFRWRHIPHQRLFVHGFEPDEAECARLNTVLTSRGVAGCFHPVALWDSTAEIPFYVTTSLPSSSCFPPNQALVSRLRCSLPDGSTQDLDCSVEYVTSVRTRALDEYLQEQGLAGFDAIQIDTQGAEQRILLGGRETLRQALALKAEVWLADFYVGAARFCEVDSLLRASGFILAELNLLSGMGRKASPVNFTAVTGRQHPAGPPLTNDAFYLADPLAPGWPGTPPSGLRLLKLAVLAELSGQVEFAFEVLGSAAGMLAAEGDPELAELARAAFRDAARDYDARAQANMARHARTQQHNGLTA